MEQRSRLAGVLICIMLTLTLSAQSTLSEDCNLPRPEDRLIKQQVAHKSPGDSENSVYWDFSDLKVILQNDTFSLCEHENPTSLFTYRKPEIHLAFPFPYRRTVSSYFDATGEYCSRVKNDSILWQIDTWKWYAEEYYDLEQDTENQSKRDYLENKYRNGHDEQTISRSASEYKDETISYSYSINNQGNLDITYTAPETADLQFTLYDLQERQWSGAKRQAPGRQINRESISLQAAPCREYLLQIVCNGKLYGEKILK